MSWMLVLSLAFLTGMITSAKVLNTHGWKISSAITFVPSNKFGSTTISHMNEALWQWNKAAGKDIMFRSATERHSLNNYKTINSATGRYANRDGRNYIYNMQRGMDGIIGEADVQQTGGIVYEADIIYNTSYPFANSAQSGKYDSWSLMVHEAGHVAGLAHNNSFSSVMYNTFGDHVGSTQWRYLSADDEDTVDAIY